MSKKKKRNPNAIKPLMKKLDSLNSKAVRLRAMQSDGRVQCYTCDHRGDIKTMQAGHWIPRQHKAVRWEEWNVKAQCYACNMFYGGRPQEFRDRLIAEYGVKKVEAYALRRHETKQWTADELRDLIAERHAEIFIAGRQ